MLLVLQEVTRLETFLFLQGRGSSVPSSFSIRKKDTLVTVSAHGRPGWLLVELSINGYTPMCFFDAGSEATLIKPFTPQ